MKTLKKISLVISIIVCSTNFFAQGDPGGGDLLGGGNANSQACTPSATTWFLGGNNIVPPPPPVGGLGTAQNSAQTDAGTCNEFPFILKANNFQSVFITPAGRIGINNPAPAAALDIRNPVANNQTSFRIFGDQAGTLESTGGVRFIYESNTAFNIWQKVPNTPLTQFYDRFTIDNNGNVGIDETWPLQKLHVNGNTFVSGNLGLGVVNASEKLHVAGGNVRVDGNVGINVTPTERLHITGGNLRLDGKIGMNTTPGIENIKVADADSASVLLNTTSSNTAKLDLMNGITKHSYRLEGTGTGRITSGNVSFLSYKTLWASPILDVPQVWIGKRPTIGPRQFFTLAVDGELVAKSIYVTLNCGWAWADYVFAEDYKLPALDEVESYYKANKHLPEIPSAKEVEEKGINVGEMNVLLLKKVEELTLYIVQQQKEIDKIKTEMKKNDH